MIAGESGPSDEFVSNVFTNSTLDVFAVNASVPFPYDRDIQGDDWLTALKSTDAG